MKRTKQTKKVLSSTMSANINEKIKPTNVTPTIPSVGWFMYLVRKDCGTKL